MTTMRKRVHTTRVPIRWGDMDAMGHVNNTVYFRYMEQSRIEWLYACAADKVFRRKTLTKAIYLPGQ